jgi:hypothetical protein
MVRRGPSLLHCMEETGHGVDQGVGACDKTDGSPGKGDEFERKHRDLRSGVDVDHVMFISWTFFW